MLVVTHLTQNRAILTEVKRLLCIIRGHFSPQLPSPSHPSLQVIIFFPNFHYDPFFYQHEQCTFTEPLARRLEHPLPNLQVILESLLT